MKVHNQEENMFTAVALRGLALLPKYVAHFDVSREKSVVAIEKAMKEEQRLFLVAQKDENVEDPKPEDLYTTGVVARIHQVIKVQGGILRLIVESEERAVWTEITDEDGCLNAKIEYVPFEVDVEDETEKEAMFRELHDLFGKYLIVNRNFGKGFVKQMLEIKSLEKLVQFVASNLPLEYKNRQKLLEAKELSTRYQLLLVMLENEISIFKIRAELQSKVRKKVDENQKNYVLREQMQAIREELGEDNFDSEIEDYRSRTKKLKAPKEVKDKLNKEIDRLEGLSSNSSEGSVSRGYIDTLLELPWNKSSKDNLDIKEAKQILEDDHYGLSDVKKRVLEFLAVRALTKAGDAPIICLVGPPGTGKTSIARSIARALNKKYVRICLGGVRDEAEIRGHRKTYVGAMPGRIANGMKQAGVNNPLMLLDEIDKVSSDYKGDTQSALLEVLDSEQNCQFRDHYVELPMDLSKVLFVATANSTETISRPLLDRMEIIQISGYTENEKFHIAKKYLVSKELEKNGLKKSQLTISDNALKKIISNYTKEAGVRNLERNIAALCRKAAWKILEENKKSVKITDSNLKTYLGKEKFHVDMANEKPQTGIVRGLAWTSVGGDTLEIEVNVMPGKGEILLTGKLGEVMQESARTGISYIRSVSKQYKIADDFFKKHDIHIHIPEGAVPKDGPSAGITMATAILSAVTDTPVKPEVAMTGEITLRGRVLPIGGLKEKMLAAKLAGIKTILVPKKNEPDVEEIDDEIKLGMKICFVEKMEQVIKEAFV
mgnify:CR=1 FL=1